MFKNYIPFDIFGMPSGHSQSAAFSTLFIFLGLKNYSILYFYLIITIITMIQRVVYDYHTLFQVFVGILVGMAFSYCMYYLAQQKMKGIIREKPDDFGPI
jgi:membrane-associated phospholipid phosphatase